MQGFKISVYYIEIYKLSLKVARFTNSYFSILLKQTSNCRTCVDGYKKYSFLKYIPGILLFSAVCQGVFNFCYVEIIIYFCLRAKSYNYAMTIQHIVYEMVLAVSNRRRATYQMYQSYTKHKWFILQTFLKASTAKMSVDTDQEGLNSYQLLDGALETAA